MPTLSVDHWSSNAVVQAAVTKNIGGLGEALEIARDVERIIDHRSSSRCRWSFDGFT
jgi:hypothetical protein